jgi:hypothetical protein
VKLIPLYRAGEVAAHAKVDDEDFEGLNIHRWRFHPNGYAQRGRKGVLMHREIMGLVTQPGHAHKGRSPEVDHLNRDKLDNQRSNLRVVDRTANIRNRSGLGKSKHKGVSSRQGSEATKPSSRAALATKEEGS